MQLLRQFSRWRHRRRYKQYREGVAYLQRNEQWDNIFLVSELQMAQLKHVEFSARWHLQVESKRLFMCCANVDDLTIRLRKFSHYLNSKEYIPDRDKLLSAPKPVRFSEYHVTNHNRIPPVSVVIEAQRGVMIDILKALELLSVDDEQRYEYFLRHFTPLFAELRSYWELLIETQLRD